MQRGNKSNEGEISLCFQVAIQKLDKIDADAKKEKTQIVQDLAKDLEGKITMDRIAIEIVHQLHRKILDKILRIIGKDSDPVQRLTRNIMNEYTFRTMTDIEEIFTMMARSTHMGDSG